MAEKTAREAVEQALADSSDYQNFSIQAFWMSLYEHGYEVVPLTPKGARIDGSQRE